MTTKSAVRNIKEVVRRVLHERAPTITPQQAKERLAEVGVALWSLQDDLEKEYGRMYLHDGPRISLVTMHQLEILTRDLGSIIKQCSALGKKATW
jgi:hypothetical protein